VGPVIAERPVWCETVTAFLDHHLLGKDWQTPDLLR
jgi:hypothetical protein